MIKGYQLSSLGQSLLDIGVKVGVFAVLLVLNFISAGLTNGQFQLPYPALSLPILTLLVSQFDSLVIDWANKNNVPLPK